MEPFYDVFASKTESLIFCLAGELYECRGDEKEESAHKGHEGECGARRLLRPRVDVVQTMVHGPHVVHVVCDKEYVATR
jgi:hypothetical protein